MEYTKQELEDIYVKAFEKELDEQSHRGYVVYSENPDGTRKEYSDTGPGKFYLCGWAWLKYRCNSPEGRKAHKYFKDIGFEPSKMYNGGFSISLDSSRGHSNGMFEIMVAGYQEVARKLKASGIEVNVESRLD